MKGLIDPYLRVLAAVSLVVVVSGIALGPAWLPLVFPAVGVLFAVGGAVAASAVDRTGSARAFLRRALTAFLLPFWLFAGAVVTTMLVLGWSADPYQGTEPFSGSTAWLWAVPISHPPMSTEGLPWAISSSYAPALLWLVLATPALLWLFRRWPWRLLSVPVTTLLLLTTGLVTVTGSARRVLLEVCVYACCWLVGFARADGRLARIPLRPALLAGTALIGSALVYVAWRQEVSEAGTIDDLPLAALLHSLGAVLLLFRIPWRGDRLVRGWLGAAGAAVGGRALTVFLWTPAAAAAAVPVLAASPLAAYHTADASGALLRYGTTWLLLLAVALLLGWAEDVGAGRRPAFIGVRRAEQRPLPAPPERTFVVRDNLVQELPAFEPAEAAVPTAATGSRPLRREPGPLGPGG